MKFTLTQKALRQYKALPPRIRSGFDKQLHFLLTNLRHRSLDAKKYDERQDIWQARVTQNYRTYFRIEGDTYHILAITKHPK